MDPKTTDWRAGPNVCRCCLAEGCYKDISTEYFWMGKREVYAEMLSETLNLSIAYSNSGGPNSNSRLICELCISRLRDASDFKRQVQECERTFLRHLDPGSSSMVGEVEVTVEPTEIDPDVKLEHVKQEKPVSDDDDDFDERCGFDEDDDDDLDDQPLTRLASRIPKKESVDLLDLLDNTKATEKRKSSSKTKTVPAKKAKTVKKDVKATSSKAPVKTEKKKKGRNSMRKLDSDSENNTPEEHIAKIRGKQRRATFRSNIALIMSSCTAYPFKYKKGAYLCFFCSRTFLAPEELRKHSQSNHSTAKSRLTVKKYEPLKMDFSDTVCRICSSQINDYAALKEHLAVHHGKIIDCTFEDCVMPYKLNKDEHTCLVCGKTYETFLGVHKHMNSHYEHYICESCGNVYVTYQRLVNHIKNYHSVGDYCCKLCSKTFPSYSAFYSHDAKVHRNNKRYKCPICDEKFSYYKLRLNHLAKVHGEKSAMYPCPVCPKVFDLCSRRTNHLRIYHAVRVKSHVCTVCGMAFYSGYELKEHSVKHGGERIFQCDICKKSYARMKTLREHMKIHNNDRRFVCPACGQTFIQKATMKNHMRALHPEHFKDMFN